MTSMSLNTCALTDAPTSSMNETAPKASTQPTVAAAPTGIAISPWAGSRTSR